MTKNSREEVFLIIFKGLSLKQIKQFFLEGASPTLTINTLKSKLPIKPRSKKKKHGLLDRNEV